MSTIELRDCIDAFDATLPIERAWTPPSSWYTDDRLYALGRDTVFRSSWQPAARLDQLKTPGSYVSGCLLGEPWVVLRDAEGELRAFYDVNDSSNNPLRVRLSFFLMIRRFFRELLLRLLLFF